MKQLDALKNARDLITILKDKADDIDFIEWTNETISTLQQMENSLVRKQERSRVYQTRYFDRVASQ